jgi:hypothetical protein
MLLDGLDSLLLDGLSLDAREALGRRAACCIGLRLVNGENDDGKVGIDGR